MTGDSRAARAFALVAAGRLAPSEGRLRVAGHLLPERAVWVRAHVGLALLGDAEDRVEELRRALAGRTGIVVVDGVDTLEPAERDQAAALLRDAAAALTAREDAKLTLVVTARAESAAIALLADAHRPDVASLTLGSTLKSSTAEVNA